jgi:hypothetical protein
LNPNRFAGDLFADECLLNGRFVNCGRYSLQNALLSSAILEELKSKMMVGWLMDKWAVIKTLLNVN